eukprot:TRINITY_DN4193_c0_g1_i12.p1 TRINITY_DN4193_c0_g1~~TRINITY_DN4193_c0_g1_i12.p1  ORF type:complete len:614 (-),score=122.64 TRINITY_DN4193_c0_g1_i12:191-2032(-)
MMSGGSDRQQLILMEKQLVWIVYISSASLSARYRGNGEKQETDQLDAQALCCLFDTLNAHDQRLGNCGASPASVYLELAFIYFMQMFCRSYVSDAAFNTCTFIYQVLGSQVNLKSPSDVIDYIVSKIIRLMSLWKDNEHVIEETLSSEGLFWSLATGFSSVKYMNNSPLVTNILENHATIDLGRNKITRRSFYKTLGRLMFSGSLISNFHAFVLPWQQTLEQIKVGLMSENRRKALDALKQVLNDLRGLVESITSKDRGYLTFFDWFHEETQYHDWLGQLIAQADQLKLEEEDCWTIIHFVEQFSKNDQHRIVFPITSANGIRLFRSSSQILIHFGKYIMNSSKREEDKDIMYKSLRLYLQCFHTLMSGGYTNFGVFEMYSDNTLNELLQVTCRLLFGLDMDQLELYPKTNQAVHQALTLIITNHVTFVIHLETNAFGQVLRILLRGLQSETKTSLQLVAAAVDVFFSRYIKNMLLAKHKRHNSRVNELEPMTNLIKSHQSLVNQLTIQFFTLLLSMEAMHWCVGKPLLSLILLSEYDFKAICQLMVKSQAHDESKAMKLNQLFEVLMKDIQPNLENTNRDKFVTNCGTFKTQASTFLDLNSLYKAIIVHTHE